MHSIKILLAFLCIPFLFVSCEKDNYLKAELRCYIDGKPCTIPREADMDENMQESKAYFNKQDMDLSIQGTVLDKNMEVYKLFLHIKPFTGAGYYPVQMLGGFVSTPGSSSASMSNYYDIDTTHEGAFHVTKFIDGKSVGGYFHFVGKGDLCGDLIHISNGRFGLKAGS